VMSARAAFYKSTDDHDRRHGALAVFWQLGL